MKKVVKKTVSENVFSGKLIIETEIKYRQLLLLINLVFGNEETI